MTIKVRYLSEDEIEKEAELLLAEYAETVGGPIKMPVPVEDITTFRPGETLGFASANASGTLSRERSVKPRLSARA